MTDSEWRQKTRKRQKQIAGDRLGMETDNQKETETETDRQTDRLWETGRQTQSSEPKSPLNITNKTCSAETRGKRA